MYFYVEKSQKYSFTHDLILWKSMLKKNAISALLLHLHLLMWIKLTLWWERTLKSNSKQHQTQEKENGKNFSFVKNHQRNVKLHGECLMLFWWHQYIIQLPLINVFCQTSTEKYPQFCISLNWDICTGKIGKLSSFPFCQNKARLEGLLYSSGYDRWWPIVYPCSPMLSEKFCLI